MIMNNKFKVSVVIPGFNNKPLLEKNLPSLIEAEKNNLNNIIEIIVVDDGSNDDTCDFIKKNYPTIKLFKHSINRGFSAAINSGVRSAKGELVLLLNTDVVPSNNFLVGIFGNFLDPDVFAVSLHENGYGPAKGSFFDGYIQLIKGEENNNRQESFYVSGGSGIFKRSIWFELGGMDEKLLSPFYWEDIDLCYRAAKRGYKLIWEPGALVYHQHESTVNKLPLTYVNQIRERNQLLMLWKNITSKYLIRKHIFGIIKRSIKHPGYIRIVFMALTKISILIPKRRREIKESKISDEVIFAKYV